MTRMISTNFTWDEATFTTQRDPGTGLVVDNEPDAGSRLRLEHTFDRMERVRFICGDRPVVIHSAFRNPLVNRLVGGSLTSQHMRGEAVDFHVIGLTILETFDRLRHSTLDHDQVIEESATWVHVSFVQDRAPRGQALRMRVVDGRAHYEPVT